MDSLSHFLEKFKTFLATSKNTKEAVITILATQAKISLSEKDIDIKEGILYTKLSPMARNTIFMQKKKILEELQRELGDRAPRDIR